jgi:hypothetical protein
MLEPVAVDRDARNLTMAGVRYICPGHLHFVRPCDIQGS